MQLHLSSHGVMFSDMVGVSLLLCTQKEAVRVLEMKQEMPSICCLLMWTCLHEHTCMMICAFIAQKPPKVICMVWRYSSCSSSWVQDLHFNYKVLFPTSAWLLTPSLQGTCTTDGNTVKTVFLMSSIWGPWGGCIWCYTEATSRNISTSPISLSASFSRW